jgi:hypothetical protein
LQFERIRQARVVAEALRFAQQCYRDVVNAGGGESLCFTLQEEVESVGVSLGKAVLEEIETEFQSLLTFSEVRSGEEQSAFACACISNAFDHLKRVSEDDQFVSVCAHAYQWCLGAAIHEVRLCEDQTACMNMVSRVTGIVDLDDVQLERAHQSSFQARLEQDAVLFVPRCYQDVVRAGGVGQSCIWSPETSQSLGIRLGESVLEEFVERLRSGDLCVLALSCIGIVFDRLRRTSEDSQFVSVCSHAYRWCIGQARDWARQCDDQSAAMEVVRRVTGIVNLDEPVSLEVVAVVQQCSGRRSGVALQASVLASSGARSDEELWNAFWEGRCPDVDSLGRLHAEVAGSTMARGSGREELVGEQGDESAGVETPLAEVPEAATSRQCPHERGVSSSPTVAASSAPADADPEPKRRMKRVQFDEAVPLRRSSRIAERSRHADTAAFSGHRRA